MDSTVDALSGAYDDFMAAAAGAMEARQQSGGKRTRATDAAMAGFKQNWELFRVACDRAEELVESAKQRIVSESLVDEATGTAAASATSPTDEAGGAPAIAPISAVRLEQTSKAVRWIVIELQKHESESAAELRTDNRSAATMHGLSNASRFSGDSAS